MPRKGSDDGTVGKALVVLDQVAAAGRPVRFSELLEQSQFPKATLYRLLQTLANQRMLAYDAERQTYAPGLRLVRLAHAAWRVSSLAPIARPHVAALGSDLRETIHLAQLDHAQVLYVDKFDPTDVVEMYSAAGKIAPAYCTGLGKALMAWLDEPELSRVVAQQSFHRFTPNTITDAAALRAELGRIREIGHACDREEHEPGIVCVALPVLTEAGRPLAALSATTSTSRRSLDALERLVPRIRAAADAIAEEVQHWRFPDQPRHNNRTGT